MMNIEQTMLALIRSEVGGQKTEDILKEALSFEVCANLLVLSAKHDLSHLVASALSNMGLLETDDMSEMYRRQLLMAVYRDEQKNFALKQICDVLEQAHIPHIPLKGSILRKYYPQAWMRTSCDIDILIHNEDSECAIKKLCQAGYQRIEDRSAHDYNLMSPNGVHLELHYTLTQGGRLSASNHMLESVWEHVETEEMYQYRCHMTNEMFIFYHLAHMGRHFLCGGCGVRPFIDLWIIKEKMPYDAKVLKAMLAEAKLLEFFQAALGLCEVWFEGASHDAVTEKMEAFIFTGGSYGTTTNSAVVRAAKGESKIQSFFKLMFLPRVNLEVLYPNLRKYPALFSFYQIKRWFRIFKKDRRNRIMHLTAVRRSVSQNEAEETTKLLESLGLL